jgi:hypothetical protein
MPRPTGSSNACVCPDAVCLHRLVSALLSRCKSFGCSQWSLENALHLELVPASSDGSDHELALRRHDERCESE